MAILIPRYAREPFDPKRRSLLVAALEAGVFGATALPLTATPAAAAVLGNNPGRLPPGRSIYTLEGSATINGADASLDSAIKPGDTVETARDSRLIFVDRGNAHILRANSRVSLPPANDTANVLRVFTGVLLSVFGRRKRRLVTAAATIGIRGTGVYIESDPEESYICTCYGTADLMPFESELVEETVFSEHHDEPRYAVRDGGSGKRFRRAPFKDHTDLELALIEGLVGRSPPFSFMLDQFDSPAGSY